MTRSLFVSLALCAAVATVGGCAKTRPSLTTAATVASRSDRQQGQQGQQAQQGQPANQGQSEEQVVAAAAGSPVARLQQELAQAFGDPSVNALWAVEIQSFETGEVFYQQNAHLLVMPASNMKIVTMAVAADRLGWDFRFTTEVKTRGAVAGGVLKGDLVVSGNGDPTMSDRDKANRYQAFESWADQLKAAGISRIDGRIIGDDNLFDDQPLGEGWMWDDLTGSSAPPGGALQFNENLVRVVIAPAATAGQPATVRLEPEGSGLTLRANVMTVAAPTTPTTPVTPDPTLPRALRLSRGLGSSTLEVTGVILAGAPETSRLTPVLNPTIYYVNSLRDTLIRKGVEVAGAAVDIDDVMDEARPAGLLRTLITHQSPPLSEIGKTFMKVSQNTFGETLMTTIGERSGHAQRFVEAAAVQAATAGPLAASVLPAQHYQVEAAREVYEEVLSTWGIPETQHVLADGSGLSRYNFVTAHMLVRILRQMARDPRHAAAFEATLPIAGKDGTLERRMKGTRAENNVHAKTGTISNVRSLSGYVRTRDNELIGFSVIANNFKARSATIDAVAELAVERLANFTREASKPR
jgi:D-alanyl-D-alanine carboxypeptidase/D-alanyl-D-alanine-endopeptidase (penicillin-binding protein 4)